VQSRAAILSTVRATAKDREHLRRVAEGKRLERDQRRREAAARDPGERIVEGLALGLAFPQTPAMEEMERRRALGQGELHARWRRIRSRR
jgi:hypothetical protein